MGFHYGYEKRKFDAEWTRLEHEYRAAGMDDRQIAAMKEYDWSWFCSQRTYQNRVQALPSEQCEDESEQSCLFRKRVYVDSWSEQYRHELFALGLSDMVCTFVCDYCSCHASGYNKGGDLSSPKEIHRGEVA